MNEKVIDFMKLCFKDRKTWDISWLGRTMLKNPMDMWIYQEIICERKPDIIVETGTYRGGSSYFYATMMDLIGYEGRIISVDISDGNREPNTYHHRISYVIGNSSSPHTLEQVKRYIKPNDKVMVMLDSSHRGAHVQLELPLFCELVTVGQYVVVEDTFLGDMVDETVGGLVKGTGPREIVDEFLKNDDRFRIDKSREKLLYTFYPDGFLERIK